MIYMVGLNTNSKKLFVYNIEIFVDNFVHVYIIELLRILGFEVNVVQITNLIPVIWVP